MSNLLYRLGHLVFYLYLKLLYRLKVHGKENIPARKPFIICSNHISWLDPMTVGTSFPARYRIHFMAKKELFSNFLFSFALSMVGAFPVNRKDADYAAFRKAYRLLKEKKVLGLFPEGSRSKDGKLKKAQNGAALIAVRSGVPVLPVAIAGPYQLLRPLNVYIGPPFVLPPLVYQHKHERKEKLNELSFQIMDNIRRLLPEQG